MSDSDTAPDTPDPEDRLRSAYNPRLGILNRASGLRNSNQGRNVGAIQLRIREVNLVKKQALMNLHRSFLRPPLYFTNRFFSPALFQKRTKNKTTTIKNRKHKSLASCLTTQFGNNLSDPLSHIDSRSRGLWEGGGRVRGHVNRCGRTETRP